MTDQGRPDRLPPYNAEAERSVLGSILRNNPVMGDVVQVIQPDHFYADAHQKIFLAIKTLYEKGHPIDLITLAEQLKKEGQIEDVGGYAFLGELWEAAPTAANAVYYAEIVRDKAITRSLIHVSTEILRDAYDQAEPADDLLAGAERKILDIAEHGVTGQTITLQDAIKEAFDRIDGRTQNDGSDDTRMPTGFVDLDEITAGFHNSELVIVAARPSVGKTSIALNFARHAAVEEKQPVFFVSLEQSRIEIAERLLCAQARVDSHKLRKGALNGHDIKMLTDAGDLLSKAKLFIDDSPGQGMLRISANARRLKLRHGIRLVLVDYLQLIEPDSRRDSRQEQVAQISRRLKFLAKELKIPVIALAQLNRGLEDRQGHEPRLADLRESGSIEQDADTVFLIHRPEMHEPGQHEGVVEIIVAKQRNGPTGKVTLTYVKQYMRFENFAVDPPFNA
jgi:replicative DNA helicase